MSTSWFYRIDQREYGPCSTAEMRALARQGQLTIDHSVRKGIDGNWVASHKVIGLHEVAEIAPPASNSAHGPTQTSPKLLTRAVTRRRGRWPEWLAFAFCGAMVSAMLLSVGVYSWFRNRPAITDAAMAGNERELEVEPADQAIRPGVPATAEVTIPPTAPQLAANKPIATETVQQATPMQGTSLSPATLIDSTELTKAPIPKGAAPSVTVVPLQSLPDAPPMLPATKNHAVLSPAAPPANIAPAIPPAAPIGVEVDLTVAASIDRTNERISALLRIRSDLLGKRQAALAEKQRLEQQIQQTQLALQGVVQQINLCKAQVGQLQLDIIALDSARNDDHSGLSQFDRDREIRRLESQQRAALFRLQQLDAEGCQKTLQLQADGMALQAVDATIQGQSRQAEQLRTDWLPLCDFASRRCLLEQEAALRVFTAALDEDATNYGARLGRGVSLTWLGRPDEALNVLHPADAADNPLLKESLAFRGYLKVLRGNDREGFVELGKAVTLDKKSSLVYWLRGQALAFQQKFPSAENDLKLAVQLDPTSADVWTTQAFYYAAAKTTGVRNHRLAHTAAEKACVLTRRQDWKALLALAATNADDGQFDQAAELAIQAAGIASGENRARCLKHQQLYLAKEPLRIDWTLEGS